MERLAVIRSQMLPAGDEWRSDGKLLREIQTTHSFAAKPIPVAAALMDIVENTLNLVDQPYQPNEQENSVLEALGPIIHKISCELSSNCSVSQGSLEHRTLNLLILLERFSWDAKTIIILAGFATNYAEYFLIDKVYTNNTTAKGLLQLKRLGQKDIKHNGDVVKVLVTKATGIIRNIFELKRIQDNFPAVSIDITDFQYASFWIIYAVLICSSEISGYGAITEHASTKKKIDSIYIHVSSKLKECQALEEEYKINKEYEQFASIFGDLQADNMAILELLLNCKEDEELISSKDPEKNIKLSVLKKGTVIVLFSSLYIDAYSEEVSLIEAFSKKTNTNNDQYHIVWLPVGHTKDPKTYEDIVSNKPWYYLKFESLVKQNVVLEKYARKEWGFNEKPMLMVLKDGKVIHHDALSLIHMWGHLAFPFGVYEGDLWRGHGNSLGIQFIVDFLHDDLTNPAKDETPQYVCVFGGRRFQIPSNARVANENGSTLSEEEWFADLAGKLMAATSQANIKLKMAYLSTNKEEVNLETSIKTNVRENIKVAQYEQSMQYVEVEQVRVKLFWSRAKSIALQLSGQKENKALDMNLEAMLENTRSILQYSLESTAWVLIGRLDTNDMIFYDAEHFFKCLENINDVSTEAWHVELDSHGDDFIIILRRWLDNGFTYDPKPVKKHCFKHVAYGDATQKGGMKCVICYKPMKKVVLYQCCE